MPADESLEQRETEETKEKEVSEEEVVTLTKSQLAQILEEAKVESTAKDIQTEEEETEEAVKNKEEYLLRKIRKFEDIQKNFYTYLNKSLMGLNNADAIKDFVIERILKGDPINNVRFMAKKMDEAIEKAKGKDNRSSEVDELFDKLKEANKELSSRLGVNVTPGSVPGAMTYREAKAKGMSPAEIEALIRQGKIKTGR